MEYIKIPTNVVIDYIPKDFKLCKNCLYEGICPWEWNCPTLERVLEAEAKVKE